MIPEIHDYMAAGLHVFGLYGVDKNGKCECGSADCKALLKHPRQSNWQHTPLWSDEQMDVFEQMGHWRTGFGVLIQGLLVIDVDARNGGVTSWQRLRERIPSLADCGFVVNTGSGNGSQHLYYRVVPPMALVQKHSDYPGIDFKTSGYAVGAGSLHISGSRYEVERGYPQDIGPAPDALVSLLRRPDTYRASIDGAHVDIGADGILELLAHIDPDTDYDTWIRCGMAIHHVMLGGGLELWDQWSSLGKKYKGAASLEKHWHSFGKSAQPVGLGTLMHYAQQGGYVQPVTFVYHPPAGIDAVVGSDGEIDTSGVDLLRPPGFVGEVCQWINDQCQYPRENHAVASALFVVGALCGMRMRDAINKSNSMNLFVFCPGGSSTGKNSVLNAATSLLVEAGAYGAIYGKIKSTKEMIENLFYHQASFFIVDEIATQLQRIVPAPGRNIPAHLEEVMGRLMTLYSSACSNFTLGGDESRELKTRIKKDISMLYSKIDDLASDSEYDSKRAEIEKQIETRQQRLKHAEKYGLAEPFVGVLGFTAPRLFASCITYEFATGGMLSRSMIFSEPETVPIPKDQGKEEDFRPRPLPDSLKAKLQALYSCGHFDFGDEHRVQRWGDYELINTQDDARKLLRVVRDKFRDRALEMRTRNSLEPIHLRGHEMTCKVSLILAADTRLRTVEHVLWAFALVWRDCERKAMLAFAEDAKDTPHQKQDALMASVMTALDDDRWATFGEICGQRRKTPKEEIKRCLDFLVENGLAQKEIREHPKNRSITEAYRLASRH